MKHTQEQGRKRNCRETFFLVACDEQSVHVLFHESLHVVPRAIGTLSNGMMRQCGP